MLLASTLLNPDMNPTNFTNLVDHAAAMSDRWLFLAALCLLLITCATVIYWLVHQLQNVISSYKSSSQDHHDQLVHIIATQNETALKLAVCIDRNTEAMQTCQRRSELHHAK